MEIDNIRPLGNKVLVEFGPAENKTKSGLIIPDSAVPTRSNIGTVVAVHPKSELKVGDKVYLGSYQEIPIVENKFYFIREDQIHLLVEEIDD